MRVITDVQYSAYQRIRSDNHPGCIVCGEGEHECGLGLDFCVTQEDTVEASFTCDKMFQGYPALLHGGIISTILDGAMTNCLFAEGYAAVTAELKVRFRHPVVTEQSAKVRAWITASNRPLHELAAELVQNDQVKATAKAKFLEKTAMGLFGRKEV